MTYWYCARTNPGKEWSAQRELTRQGIDSFLPCYMTKSKSGNINHRLLFHNYIFFALSDVTFWPQIQRSYDIAKVLTYVPGDQDQNSPDTPWYAMPSAEGSETIVKLRKQCLELDEVRRNGKRIQIARKPHLLPVGCMVKIISGPYQMFSVQKPIVEWSEAEKAGLILNLFGRRMVLEFFQKDLEMVQDTE